MPTAVVSRPTAAGSDGTSGRAELLPRASGTTVRLQVLGLDPAGTYGVWLAREGGARLSAGSFVATGTGSVEIELSAALALPATRVVGVTRLPVTGDGPVDVLVGAVG